MAFCKGGACVPCLAPLRPLAGNVTLGGAFSGTAPQCLRLSFLVQWPWVRWPRAWRATWRSARRRPSSRTTKAAGCMLASRCLAPPCSSARRPTRSGIARPSHAAPHPHRLYGKPVRARDLLLGLVCAAVVRCRAHCAQEPPPVEAAPFYAALDLALGTETPTRMASSSNCMCRRVLPTRLTRCSAVTGPQLGQEAQRGQGCVERRLWLACTAQSEPQWLVGAHKQVRQQQGGEDGQPCASRDVDSRAAQLQRAAAAGPPARRRSACAQHASAHVA